MPTYYVVCACGCDEVFEASRSNQKYKDKSHYNKHKRDIYKHADYDNRVCDNCSELFKPSRSHQRFCSGICRSDYRKERVITIPLSILADRSGTILVQIISGKVEDVRYLIDARFITYHL